MPRRRYEPDPIESLGTCQAAYVTARQLADYWAVHVVTIQRWLRAGTLRGARFRGAWRIAVDDARAFEAELFRARHAS